MQGADRWFIDSTPSERYPVYTRANAGEVLPRPVSPLYWTLIWQQGCGPGWYDAMIAIGVAEPHEVTPEEIVGLFGGYGYINASLARLFGVRGPDMSPEQIDATYFGDHPDVPPYVAAPWHESESNTAKIGAWMQHVLTDPLDELLADREEADRIRADRPHLRTQTDHDLVERARHLVPVVRRMFERHLTVTAGAAIGPGILAAVADAVGDPTLALKLITSVGDVDSALPSRAMWELSRLDEGSPEFRSAFAGFLATFGSRGPNEWDTRSDSWETAPRLALQMIEVMRKSGEDVDPFARSERDAAEREAIADRLRTALAGEPETLARFEAGLVSAHRYLAGRERTKTTVIKVINEIRIVFRELADRLEYSPSQVNMLLADELDAFVNDPEEFRARLDQREEQYLRLFELEPPFIIDGVAPPLDRWARVGDRHAPTAAPGAVLHGVPGSPGMVTARARVVLDPADPLALEPGEILVAPITDPAWTPLFVPAVGVIVDVGAPVSHAVIVSRELGIPCVVSVERATEMIPDGATVTIDGDHGTVTLH